MSVSSTSARIVPAVDRAVRILTAIESQTRPMSITELAKELGASKGTVREILETLRLHGLLERNEETKRYRLGPELVRLGASSREGQRLPAIARPHLAALSDSLKENVLLLVIHDDHLLIRDACEPRDPNAMILVSATPGRTLPIDAGACGKVISVWGDADARALVAASTTRKRKIGQAELKRVKLQGYATDDQEFIEGVRAVSVPILDASEQLVALILVSGIAASLSRDRFDEVGLAARAVAQKISRLLGRKAPA